MDRFSYKSTDSELNFSDECTYMEVASPISDLDDKVCRNLKLNFC